MVFVWSDGRCFVFFIGCRGRRCGGVVNVLLIVCGIMEDVDGGFSFDFEGGLEVVVVVVGFF